MSEGIDGLETVRAIAWDFDGVLNRAGVRGRDGAFRWEHRVRAELGLDVTGLNQQVFGTALRAMLTGQEDILDRVQLWCDAAGCAEAAEDIVELMFETEHDPDPDLLRLIAQLDRAGLTQVIATNNDLRRTRFIAVQSGIAEALDGVFSSGDLGVMKPEAAFYERVETGLGLVAPELLLIDDLELNTDAAEKRGWRAWHYQPGGSMALVQALMPLLLRAES